MVAAPMMMQGVDVNLPKTTTKNIKTKDEPLMLTVNKKKEIFLENHSVTLDRLELKIKKILKTGEKKRCC